MKKLQVSKTEFKRLYMQSTNADLANKLGISHVTIMKLAKEMGLSKGKGFWNSVKFKGE